MKKRTRIKPLHGGSSSDGCKLQSCYLSPSLSGCNPYRPNCETGFRNLNGYMDENGIVTGNIVNNVNGKIWRRNILSCLQCLIFTLLLVVAVVLLAMVGLNYVNTSNNSQLELSYESDKAKELEINKLDVEILIKSINHLMETNKRLSQSVEEMKSSLESLKKSRSEMAVENMQSTEVNIKKVSDELTVYDADKLGLADFALETAGGSVISTPETESILINKTISVLGFQIPWPVEKSPRHIIQASVYPGECWAFSGSSGKIIIKLAGPVFIQAVTMEHIPVSISLTGNIDSAPHQFSVIGLINDAKGDDEIILGYFKYDIEGPPRQTFSVQLTDNNSQRPFTKVKLWIINNHGNPHYTCVYRFRVHGTFYKDNVPR